MDDPIMIDTIRQRIANSEPCFIYENEALMLIARIEQLEAALEKIGVVASQYSIRSGLAYRMINIARTALEGKNG